MFIVVLTVISVAVVNAVFNHAKTAVISVLQVNAVNKILDLNELYSLVLLL